MAIVPEGKYVNMDSATTLINLIKTGLAGKLGSEDATVDENGVTINEHQLEPMDDEEVTDLWESIEPTPGSGGSAYILPIASANTLGGIKVGDSLTIDNNGVLNTQKVSDVKLLMYSADKNINTQDEAYTATEACDVICFNYDVNGEASTQTLGSIISTTGTENGSYTNSSGYSSPNRNYSLTIKSISLQVGDTVTFSHGSSHSGSYTQQIHIIIKVKQAYTTISSVYFSAKQDTGISYTENISTTGDYFALTTQTKYSTMFENISGIGIGSNPDISVNDNGTTITNKVALFIGEIESGKSVSFSATPGSTYETQTAMIMSLS